MLIAVWIVSGLLALVYLASGGMKVFTPREKLKERQAWVENAPTWFVKTVGILEVLGAIALILPPLLNIAPVLAPIAAVGLALIQVVAIPLHLRRHDDPRGIPVNVVLLALAVFVAVARFAGV